MSGGAVDVVVLTAMPEEAQPFLERAETASDPASVGGSVQRLLSLGGRSVLLVQSGIGLVNAACALSLAVAARPVGAVVSAGSAGGLGQGVRVGDVVVGTEHLYAGADVRAFGYALGQVPGMPASYAGDAALVAAATDGTPPSGLTLRTGLMLSGDSFVHAGLVDAVREAFPGALSTDMESTALAQVAHLHGLPFVSVRGISDLCGPAADDDFLTHVDDAADRSADVVLALLRSASALLASPRA